MLLAQLAELPGLLQQQEWLQFQPRFHWCSELFVSVDAVYDEAEAGVHALPVRLPESLAHQYSAL